MKEIDINIEGFNENGICVGCLNYNRKMVYHKDIKECFIILADIYIPDGLQLQVCWECLVHIKRTCQFRKQIIKSYEILNNYSKQHSFLHSPSDFTKYSTTRLCTASVAVESIMPPSTLSMEIEDNVDKLQIKCESGDLRKPIKEEVESYNEYEDIPIEYEHYDVQSQHDKDELSSEDDVQLSELKHKKQRKERSKIKKHGRSSSDMMASSSESGDSEDVLTPPELKETAQEVIETLLPEKSSKKYNKAYEEFIQWKTKKNAPRFTENVLLTYFSEKAQTLKPSSVWAYYSMLKTTILAKNNINIVKYRKLTAFLRRNAKGFRSKKSKVLTTEDVYTFLEKAPDDIYLLSKVILILCVNGACRSHELLKLTIDDIELHENVIIVKLPNTKTKIQRSFVITDVFYEIVKKYIDLRPKKLPTNRFLLQYKDNRCLTHGIGKNKMKTVPKAIASYLKLPDPQEYTGHCFRRILATVLADSGGANLTALKRHDGCQSLGVADGFIRIQPKLKQK
ncbi:unnamed protein product [Chilo suppressalis]|uniref:Tyr recombinase domain-containing protein n=1 Tax=Chilo suppressalis TaxID=168631 RepID=A0ABN8B6U0_CHISP|nr:hypothetical protein evm_008148 [Chilo suppressalis]CAH0404081.1 unnamed protein product [Chilo suppressalis]